MASVGDNIRSGGAKGLPRSLVQLIANIDAEIAAAGAAPKAFMHARMDQQTGGVSVSEHVEFDAELENDGSGAIVLSSGNGDQLDGIITLGANRSYDCLASLRIDLSSATDQARFRWFDISGGVEFGAQAEYFPMTATANRNDQPVASGIITVGGSPITIELRLLALTGTLSTIQGSVGAGDSFVKIIEIG